MSKTNNWIGQYILDEDRNPVECHDILVWGRWLETADRKVAHSTVGDIRISTVFLGLDHNFYNDGPPMLFDTMVFGGKLDKEMGRYSTWNEAERGHKKMVAKVIVSETNPGEIPAIRPHDPGKDSTGSEGQEE